MRQFKRGGNFFLCLLVNMLLNIEGIIPSAVLLILHFVWDIPLWWSAVAFGLWILVILAFGFFVGWASRCASEPNPPKENKNPYSSKNNNM